MVSPGIVFRPSYIAIYFYELVARKMSGTFILGEQLLYPLDESFNTTNILPMVVSGVGVVA